MKAPYPCPVSDCMGYLYTNINKIIKLLNSTRGSYVTDVSDDRFIIQTIPVLYRGSLSYIFKTEVSNNYFHLYIYQILVKISHHVKDRFLLVWIV